MARCPDCNKFATKDVDTDPEITKDLEVDKDGEVTLHVRIHNDCADCSTELEEAEFELSAQIDEDELKKEHRGKGHMLSVQEEEPEIERTDSSGGRYAKRMFGVSTTVTINCECGDSWNVDLKDEIASSAMESTV